MSIVIAQSPIQEMRALLVNDSPSSLCTLSHLVEEGSGRICVALTDPWAALDAA